MRTYILDRVGSKDWGTLGVLYEDTGGPKLKFVGLTLEPAVPITPFGVYTCNFYTGGRRKAGVFVLDDPLTPQPHDVEDHTYVEIHVGNWSTETKGCILLGSVFWMLQGRLALGGSTATFDAFMKDQGKESFTLIVR